MPTLIDNEQLRGPIGSGPISLEYLFSTSTATTDPGSGKVAINDADVLLADTWTFSENDANGINRSLLIEFLGDAVGLSEVLGLVQIHKRNDPTAFVVAKLYAVTPVGGTHYQLDVVSIDASGSAPFSANDQLVFQFSRSGFDGSLGVDGATGATGPAGATGPKPAGQIWLSAAGMWPSITSGCSEAVQEESTTNDENVYTLAFIDAAQKFSECNVMMPSDYDGGTVTAVFVWKTVSATSNSVVWAIQARAFGDGDLLDQAFGSAQGVADANAGTAEQIRISAATSAITIGGTSAASKLVCFKVLRDGAHASDTLAADAKLLGVMVNYTRA